MIPPHSRGCLREGAKSYGKRFAWLVDAVLGQQYSAVRLMCSQPRGETWARNSAGISRPALRLAKTAWPSCNVFQSMMVLLHTALRHPAAAGDLPLRAARLVAQPQYFLDGLHRDPFPRHRNLLSRTKVAVPADAATLRPFPPGPPDRFHFGTLIVFLRNMHFCGIQQGLRNALVVVERAAGIVLGPRRGTQALRRTAPQRATELAMPVFVRNILRKCFPMPRPNIPRSAT